MLLAAFSKITCLKRVTLKWSAIFTTKLVYLLAEQLFDVVDYFLRLFDLITRSLCIS